MVSGCYFDVFLGDVTGGLIGQFLSVSGLGMELEYETFTEGGSGCPRRFVKSAVSQTLVLEQGTLALTDPFAAWLALAMSGVSVPMAGTVVLKDYDGTVHRIWVITDAVVTKYVGPSMDSNQPQLAVTRIELSYGGCC